jgi:predicted AlkP superfamily phosphohydrolase/phosphomutase
VSLDAANANKVVVIGFDGATFEVVNYLKRWGRLPTLTVLSERGISSTLMSVINPITPAAWTTFMTGVNPGKHGVVDFVERKGTGYRLFPVNGSANKVNTLWQIASDHGKRVCVYNVPFTYPPHAVNGIIVSGMDTPGVDKDFTFPSLLKSEILNLCPEYTVDVPLDPYAVRNAPDPKRDQLMKIEENLSTQLRILRYLFDRQPWDLFVGVIIAPDRLQHLYWQDLVEETHAFEKDPLTLDGNSFGGAILRCYERLDHLLGQLIARSPDRQFLVLSDHGFGALEKEVYLNRFLEGQGFLKFASGKKVGSLTRVARSAISRAVPYSFKYRLKQQLGLGDQYEGVLESSIDWSQTQAFAQGYYGNIYLNLKGREPMGVVEPTEYEDVLRNLTEKLEELQHPDDGFPLVEKVYRRDELYHGPQLNRLPDLVLVMRNYSHIARLGSEGDKGKHLLGRPFEEYGSLAHTGSHRLEGILFLFGQSFHHNAHEKLEGPCLADMTPTILYLLDLPIPSYIDGRVLTEFIRPGWVADHPIQTDEVATLNPPVGDAAGYQADEMAAVARRLQNLGYLE